VITKNIESIKIYGVHTNLSRYYYHVIYYHLFTKVDILSCKKTKYFIVIYYINQLISANVPQKY